MDNIESQLIQEQPTSAAAQMKALINQRNTVAAQQNPEPKAEDIEETGGAGILASTWDFIKNIPLGAVNAGKEVIESVDSAGNALEDAIPVNEFIFGNSGIETPAIPELPAPETTAGGVSRGITQFLTGFIPAFKATKAMSAGNFTRGMVAGAAADGTVFDPNDGNLSNLVNGLTEEYPALENPITGFLATNPNDSEALNRFRNVLEGAGLGLVIEPLMIAFNALRGARATKVLPEGEVAPFIDEDLWDFKVVGDQQSISSAATDVNHKSNRMPASIKAIDKIEGWKPSTTNADIGGGAGDVTKDWLATHKDIENVVYDPFNRDINHNSEAVVKIAGGGADTATVNNVLNVIPEKEIQDKVIRQAHDAVKDDTGVAYFIVHEGKGDGVGAATKNGFQHNKKTAKYIGQVEEVFGKGNVTKKGKMIIAKKRKAPEADTPKPKETLDATPLVRVNSAELDKFSELTNKTLADEDAALKFYNQEQGIDFNFEGVNGSDDIRKILNDTSEAFAGTIDEAKRGKVTFAETKAMAAQLGTSVDNVNRLYNNTQGLDSKFRAGMTTLVSSAAELDRLTKLVLTDNADSAIVALERQKAIHGALQAEVKGVQTEIARALNSMKMAVDPDTKAFLMEDINHNGSAQEWARRYQELKTPRERAVMMKGAWARSRDAVTEYFINSILSGPHTQIVNMLGNSLTASMAVAERGTAAAITKARTTIGLKTKGVELLEVEAQSFGMLQGIKDALHITTKGQAALVESAKRASRMDLQGASNNLVENADEFGTVYQAAAGEQPVLDSASKFENYAEGRTISGQSFGLDGMLGRATDVIGATIRLPGRALLTADEFFKTLGYRMELNALAYRRVIQQGIAKDNPAFAQAVADVLDNPPKDLHMASIDQARYQTFTKELEKGSIGAAVQQGVAKAPVLRFIAPFIRTPVNIMKYVGERTPAINMLVKSARDDLAAGGARRDIAMAKLSTGTMLYTAGFGLAASGQITGGLSNDPAIRRSQMQVGIQPYSFRTNDGKYIAFNRADPFGAFFGIAADISAIVGEMDDTDAGEVGMAAIMAIIKNVTSKTYLKGLSEAFAVLDDPERNLEHWLQTFATAFSPNLLAQVNRTEFDPVLRETFDMIDAFKAKLPGYSQDLPPRRDLFGEPLVLEGGLGPDLISPIYTSNVTKDKVRLEIARLEVPVRQIPKSIDGVDLTSEEYDSYSQLAGSKVRQKLETLMATKQYKDATDDTDEFDGGKTHLIKLVISKARKEALAEIKRDPEFIDLAERLLSKKIQERSALSGDTAAADSAIRKLELFVKVQKSRKK